MCHGVVPVASVPVRPSVPAPSPVALVPPCALVFALPPSVAPVLVRPSVPAPKPEPKPKPEMDYFPEKRNLVSLFSRMARLGLGFWYPRVVFWS